MTINNPVLSRFASVPSFLAPEMQSRFESCMQMLMSHPDGMKLLNANDNMAADDGYWLPATDWRAAYRPYVVVEGILQIPVKGVLLHDWSYAMGDWATGYIYIWRAFERGLADPEVKGVALMCDSPGGEVAGNFDLVDKMFARRDEKPIRAFAHESAYSAAYSIASVANDGIWVSRTGGVGSIGVVTGHMDVSEAMSKNGYKFTFIFAGKHKVDGNAYEPLPADVKARIQSRIDALYAVFVSTVARNRGMDEQAIRDTEALTFMAPEAVSNGLADHIGSLDDAVAAFAADLSSDQGDEHMSGQDNTTAVDQAAHQAAVATARTEGQAAGVTAERARITAILGSDEGKARPKAALSAALRTDMTVEQATAFLGEIPEEAATPAPAAAAAEEPKGGGSDGFEKAMNQGANPELGAAPAGGEQGEASTVDSIFASAGVRTKKAA